MIVKRPLILALVLSGAAGLPVLADFNSKDVTKAGFPAKPGEFNGQDLGQFDGKVKAAIARMKAQAVACDDKKGIECADGLEKMRDAKRICVEEGTDKDKAYGSTLPDGKPGCVADGMNISAATLCNPCLLEAVLRHEWVHVNQTPPYLEQPAFEAEKEYLQKKGVAADHPFMQWLCNTIAVLDKAEEKKKPGVPKHGRSRRFVATTPEWGYATLLVADSQGRGSRFTVDESSNQLVSFVHGDRAQKENRYKLDMAFALNVAEVPDVPSSTSSNRVLAVAGVRSNGGGVIQYLAVDETAAQVVSALGSVSISNADPLSMAFDSSTGKTVAYVLDSYAGNVWLIEDVDGDGLPETTGGAPWADLTAFGGAAKALAIMANEAWQGSVILKSQDTRVEQFVDLQAEMWALFDTDGDRTADASIDFLQGEVLAVVPFAGALPCQGDQSVELFGTWETKLELWTADSSGAVQQFLGSGVAGTDSRVTVDLSSTVNANETLAVLDLENYPNHIPGVFQVQSVCTYGSGCDGPAGEPAPLVTHSGTSSLGDTLQLEVYGVVPGTTLIFALGTGQQSIPLSGGVPGCMLLTTAETMSLALAGSDGAAQYPLQIPNSPSWVGTELFGQWIVLDPNGLYTSAAQKVVVIP